MNSNLFRARAGIDQLIAVDRRTALVERKLYIDNGRGTMVPVGAPVQHTEKVRVSNESETVWKFAPTESGVYKETAPYLLARWDADIKDEDTVTVDGVRYRIGKLTYPENFGGKICLQCRLIKL
jgi:hypothetical protein